MTDFQHARTVMALLARRYALRAIWVMSLAYPCLLLILACVINPLAGERNATLAFLLYLPQSIWIFSLLPFAVAAWFFCRRWIWIYPLLIILFMILGMGWRAQPFGPGTDGPESVTIRLMTFNRGQHSSYSLQPFKNREQPDVILLQEAPRREANYRRSEGYREFPHIHSMGEFIAMSKWPILGISEVRSPQRVVFGSTARDGLANGAPLSGDLLAMRLELALPSGDKFAIYNVHFPTPRDILNDCKRGGFLTGIIGVPGTPWGRKRNRYEDYWGQRIDQAKYFIRVVNEDPLPAIVAGDFNMPSSGYVYRMFSTHWKDSHCEAGTGFGYTFPGRTRNFFSLGGAWLRLDYVFSTDGWEVGRSVVETQGNSQHRPLSVTLELQQDASS